jgi:hypothetical protein
MQFTVRRMMAIVGVTAVLLAVLPYACVISGNYLWYGHKPWYCGFNNSGPLRGHWIADPRMGYLFFPLLSLIAVSRGPHRRVISLAIGVTLSAFMSWVLIRRLFRSNLGSIWPDWYVAAFPGLPRRFALDTFIRHDLQAFMPSTLGEWVDLISLAAVLCLLGTMLRRPVSRRGRSTAAVAVLSYLCGERLFQMWSKLTGPPPGQYGLLIVPSPWPTAMEILQGFILGATLMYCVAILALSRSGTKTAGPCERAAGFSPT